MPWAVCASVYVLVSSLIVDIGAIENLVSQRTCVVLWYELYDNIATIKALIIVIHTGIPENEKVDKQAKTSLA